MAGRWTVLHLVLLSAAAPLAAQQACPGASAAAAAAGWEAYQANDIDEARARFEAALALCAGDQYARTGLAYVHLREGDDAEAVRLWSAVTVAEPDNVDALVGLGLAAWRAGDLDGVEGYFAHVVALDPDHPTALDYLGRVRSVGIGPAPERAPLVVPDTLEYPARTNGDRFEVRSPTGWRPFYIKGVNLGAALPGRFPSQFPDSAVYARWIQGMADMNANAVRVYTIHPPAFYEALYDWNRRNPARTLWLVQGVWTELPEGHDFAAEKYEGAFFEEMRRAVDVLHGRADVDRRPGHAAGHYTADVSPWTLAFIIGREWEPFSAVAFDSIQGGRSGFDGRYLEVRGGNALDAWMARAVEHIVAYETETYHAQRPVAYTNWPTLDPLEHPTEVDPDEELAIRRARGEEPRVREREYDNDALSLDAALVRPTERLPAGYFASFHAYPYYPDFMSLQGTYAQSASSLGRSNYFGYLSALKHRHPGMPVVISEYGVPASLGSAHLQPQGWHHGGLTESEMAAVDGRLTLELAEAGMAGGAVFSWIDEWFKQNWVTLEFELPADRNRLWYNRLDAEQHYGLWAMDAPPPVEGRTLEERLEGWQRIEPLYASHELTVRAAHDAAYLWLLLEGSALASSDTALVGFDVIRPEAGDFRWPEAVGERLPVGVEFVLRATDGEVRMLADPPSNPFRLVEVGQGAKGLEGRTIDVADPPPGFFQARVEQRFNLPYYTTPNDDGVYDSLRVVVNRRRFTSDSTEYLAMGYDRGILPEGAPPDGLWERGARGDVLEVRIPWLLINVTDPSSRSVLQGPGAANTRDARRGADGRWMLKEGVRSWPDSVFGPFGTEQVEDIGIVVALSAGGAGRDDAGPGGRGDAGADDRGDARATGRGDAGATGRADAGAWRSWPRAEGDVERFAWPTWDEPAWRVRPRPAYDSMAAVYGALDPYQTAAAETRQHGSSSKRMVQEPSPAMAALRARADTAWSQGDTEAALAAYEPLMDVEPYRPLAMRRVALLHAWAERYDDALAILDRLLAIAPDFVDARVDRARVLAWSGELDRAIADLEQLLDEHPGHPAALEARALFEAWAGRLDESLQIYEELLAIAPGNGAARRQQAQVLSWASNYDASLAAYDSLLARDPDDLEARLGRATVLTFSDDLDAALAEYDRILAREPDEVRALLGRGRALGWAGRLVDGERTLRRAVAETPANAEVRVALAQNLRWQGRNAAALAELREAQRFDPAQGDVREQLRAVRASLAPLARPSFAVESDSDGNRMRTASLTAAWHVTPRTELRADAYRRDLRYGPLERAAFGATLTLARQLEPGWTLAAGAGASRSDEPGAATLASFLASLGTPGRYPAGASLTVSSAALDATAALAARGVRATQLDVAGRWTPAAGWRLDGGLGWAAFDGSERNTRRSASLSAARSLGSVLTLGLGLRAFGFEHDLTDGYFDPDFYGIGELTTRWAFSPGRWSFLLEVAPGAQRVGTEGRWTGALRTSARIAYGLDRGRELSLAVGYSSAGLHSFSTGESDYRYKALVVGVGWAF